MMKKTIFILTALAALACTAISCRKEFAEMQPGTGFTVTATIGGGTAENGTKVSANDGGSSLALKWQEGDVIIGFDNATPTPKTYAFEVTNVDNSTATLTRIEDGPVEETGTATSNPANGTKLYMFYAPGMKAGDIDVTTNPANPSLTVDISRQTAEVPALMMAQSTVQNGALTLDFTVQTALIGVKAPTMTAGSTQYSGIFLTSTGTLLNQVKFDLSGTNGTLKATYSQATAGTPSEAVNSITKETSFVSGSDRKVSDVIYIAACPFSQTAPGASLTFTAFTSDNKKEAFTKEGITSVEVGKYYHITKEFISTGHDITVSFGTATSTLFGGGLTFNTGKQIRVYSSATDYEDIDVPENAASVTITTNLDGPVTLAYPADLASDSEKALKVGISTALDASSVRAMATIGASDAEATLENPTAVFKVTLPSLSGMTGLKIKSLPPASSTSRSGTKADINTEGTDMTVATINPASGSTFTSGGTYYVFLKPGVKLCDLAFDAITGTYTGSMAGIPESEITATATAAGSDYTTYNETAANTLYTVAGTNFHEYIQVGDVKWAKTNIGATTEQGRGEYFAWGEIKGHKLDATKTLTTTSATTTGVFTTDFKSFDHSDQRYRNNATSTNQNDRWNGASTSTSSTTYLGFYFGSSSTSVSSYSYCNTPYRGASASTPTWWKYNGTDSKTSLELMDDAAYNNWGGPWSVPAKDNFTALLSGATAHSMINNGTTITPAPNISQSAYGYQFTVTGGTVFFPAAGYGDAMDLKNYGVAAKGSSSVTGKIYCQCLYWSNTISSTVTQPYLFYATDTREGNSTPTAGATSGDKVLTNSRGRGYPIRPVSIY